MAFGINSEAKTLVMQHYNAVKLIDFIYTDYEKEEMIENAKIAAIISCNLVRDQFLLASTIGYWNNIIKEIKLLSFKDFKNDGE